MKKQKLILILTTAFIASCVSTTGSSVDSSDPKKVTQICNDAIFTNRVEQFLNCVYFPPQMPESEIASAKDMLRARFGTVRQEYETIREISLGEVDKSDTWATVEMFINYKNGETVKEKSKLVKTPDGWKLDFF